MTKYKHLALSDRNDIQLGLERGESFKTIAQFILKDPTTVSKEVKCNRQFRTSTSDGLPCPLLNKAPCVCNACPKRRQNCGYKKYSTSLNMLKNNTNKLSLKPVKGLPPQFSNVLVHG